MSKWVKLYATEFSPQIKTPAMFSSRSVLKKI